jgi:hypothetical protein
LVLEQRHPALYCARTAAVRTLEAGNSVLAGDMKVQLRKLRALQLRTTRVAHAAAFRCQLTSAARRAMPGDQRGRETRGARFQTCLKRILPTVSCPNLPAGSPGAEDGAEMGVFNQLRQPQRVANLRQALEEYLRVGLEAGVRFAT